MVFIIEHSEKCSICNKNVVEKCGDKRPQHQRCLKCRKVFFICGDCLGAQCPECKGDLQSKEETFPDNLFYAIEKGDLSEVKNICELENKNVDFIINDKGDIPLIRAAVSKQHEICQWLIDKCNASINARDKYGRTPLIEMMRCRDSNWPKKQALLFAPSVNEQDGGGKTALMFASEGAGLFGSKKGNITIIKQLLGFGADVFIKDKYRNTALDIAIRSNDRSKTSSNQTVVDYLKKVEISAKQVAENIPMESSMLDNPISDLKFIRTNASLPTVEVDLDSLPQDYHGYQKIVDQVLQVFITRYPESVMTIYVYQTQSVNFIDHMAFSAFIGIAGKKKSQDKLLDMLLNAFNKITGVNARFSDYINTTIGVCEFHVEYGQVWHPVDAGTWSSAVISVTDV
ncbi:ankyrin repeat domain-containing protein [Methylobacter psychrophilus]|uniref:ankyrin repeat domain-containing protein n=1 Tax=Methylobacter psychrophilus TaxID=96941 RepID=UPI0021D4CF63|nr:ankyrin repeat domain-containing protein [Methylobacter psychrophilus]